MKKLMMVLLCGFLMLPILANAQVKNIEATMMWDNVHEELIPEEGNFPPVTDVSTTDYFSRIRFQDGRRFPMYELSYNYDETGQISTMKFGMLRALPVKGMFLKSFFTENNSNAGTPDRVGGAYLMGGTKKLRIAAGMDHFYNQNSEESLYSVRAKYSYQMLTVMAGMSAQPNDQNRYAFGAIQELPMQLIIGGQFAMWEDETGYSFNVGRYNKRGDFAGMPSFSLNYVEVPTKYKWTNFRIMWGAKGIHYVRPTFDNPVFSGQHDIDLALLLTELDGSNYRHFDSPLIFKRYDEYGKFALRVNYIETPSTFRKFDANISANPGIDFAFFKSISGIVTVERIHNPAFGWQENRYHFTAASMLNEKVYSGLTWSTDMDTYKRVMLEFRVLTNF